MPIDRCRVCGNVLFNEPLLRYENMPQAAQFLPDVNSLERDKGITIEVCQCSGCGLVQLNNDPVPYYKDVIRASAFSEEMKGFRINQFSKFVEDYGLKGKKIIEIGCGRGEYLLLMQNVGADAFGLEHLEESVRYCNNTGLKVSQGFVDRESYEISNAPFDGFFIMNFLEHLPDPNSTLRGVYNNLSDEAIGLIEVPNFDMILQKKLFSEFTLDHLFYFKKDNLITTLKLNGFEVIELKEVWYDYIISAIVKKGRKLDMSRFLEYQLQFKRTIDEYIQRFAQKRVAIWGAGHQALSFISLMDIADKVKYVVDSAPFKQGKYTPVTHLPIMSPETLRSDPVDAIIVMAASYSDEVARSIRRNFEIKINIAILRDYGLEVFD